MDLDDVMDTRERCQ